jgi:DNA-binding MarR family transcriptional regulator
MLSNKIFELDKSLLPWVGRTMKALDYHLIEHFESNGIPLTKVQVITLRILSRNNGVAQNKLAFITNRDKASLTRLIITMEKKGLVSRENSLEDGRVRRVFITEKGKIILDSAIPVLVDMMSDVQKGISQEEIDITIEVLKKIRANVNADEQMASINL